MGCKGQIAVSLGRRSVTNKQLSQISRGLELLHAQQDLLLLSIDALQKSQDLHSKSFELLHLEAESSRLKRDIQQNKMDSYFIRMSQIQLKSSLPIRKTPIAVYGLLILLLVTFSVYSNSQYSQDLSSSMARRSEASQRLASAGTEPDVGAQATAEMAAADGAERRAYFGLRWSSASVAVWSALLGGILSWFVSELAPGFRRRFDDPPDPPDASGGSGPPS